MKQILLAILCMCSSLTYAQEMLKGKITDFEENPIEGATVYYESIDFVVESDGEGSFEIPFSENGQLVIEHIGYKQFKIKTLVNTPWVIKLQPDQDKLGEIVIQTQRKNTERNQKTNTNTMTMNSGELLKAACCNLAESFETNPSIDVNFSDAISGSKQIRMLGLTSPYILIAEENIPNVRGASQAYGLSFTPGTWVESIQITKGAGSVTNGYESISGQINTELIKPSTDIPFFLNLYGSTDSRFEINAHFNEKLNKKWSTSLFVHGNYRVHKNDMNKDGYLDNPIGNQLNVMNRWQYVNSDKGLIAILSARYMKDQKQTGQLDYDPQIHKGQQIYWGSEINTDKFDVSSKIGYVFPDMPFQSIGWQNSVSYHRQNSYFGNNLYDITQRSIFSNLVFSSIINNTKHKFTTGLQFSYDNYDEKLYNYALYDFSRTDNSVGTYFEYTFDNTDNFALVLGGRVDYSNRLGLFATPRLHLRYNVWKDGVFRLSAGRGKRLANIIAENQQLLASNRMFLIRSMQGKGYGLDPEIAWNYGVSFNQKFQLLGRNSDITFDFYRTNFENQIVVDLDYSAQQVQFYNLYGKSYANSFQVEWNYNPFKHFNIRSAYKYYDIKTNYSKGLLERPLQAKHRFFANLEYQTHQTEKGGNWRFDFTWNWLGKQRLPYTGDNSVENRLADYANAFSTFNAQITKVFNDRFEIYLGGENISDYHQHRVILGADDPFGREFDSSIIYAPIFGKMYYAGLRFKVN